MLEEQLRADPVIYPDAEDYRRSKAAGELIAPATVARFYRWLLVEVPVQAYCATQWTVRDPSHHAHWLGSADLCARI